MTQNKSNELFYALRYFLRFGKLIGLIPLGGLFTNNSVNFTFKYFSWSGLISLSLAGAMALNAVVYTVGATIMVKQDNPVELAIAAREPLFYILGCFV